ncbi:hypothetical protein WS58_29800 [Burkholderia pseudomultivorans]|uniref:YfiR family protein n=1 Tax=Burkholderia pseudomultivorans TaxID=1207504 RepID=UPI0007548882|nr:YfiR family protein [Burkholderia pseudomultivorans]KVC55660.1 hypothetical protein WS58_29800 [Burkholderia pseudomultivorans]KVG65398.1 hypothetical protein WS80_14000 [Burkholderia pseudomultivorans]KWF03275.1 hypothetical protein WT55_26970 [Burkholderia pseudomultivorans]
MDAKVRASAAGHATVKTPTSAAAIATRTTSGRLSAATWLGDALLAIVCVLGMALTALAGASVDVDGAADTIRVATPASRADPAISPRDIAVRQVVLGIVSFTRWPATPVHLHLCVTGRPDYARGLTDTLQAGSTVLDVQHVGSDDPALGIACDIIYLGTLSDDERARVRTAVAGHPVLTIAEHDTSCTAGSMFCLTVDGERVTFDINLDAVARSGVRVHPNVLNLARRPGAP